MTTTVIEPTARRPRKPRRACIPAKAPAAPAVLVRAVPPLDPPYEDAVQPPPGMDLLPVSWVGAGAGAVEPEPSTTRRSGSAAIAPPPGAPTARIAVQRFVGMCVEILNGYRPSAHLRSITDPQCFTEIADQLVRRTVRVRMSPGQAARQGRLVRVRRMLLCEPLDGIAEAAVVLEQGEATWAMALRMERGRLPGPGVVGWHCTLVRVI